MNSKILLPLVLCVAFAGCASEDIKETGVSRSRAIAIAENHCEQYPDRFGYVDRAEWNPDGRYWMVALTDRDGDHGKAFKISRSGSVIDTHSIDRSEDNDSGYYGHHYGMGWYW